MNKLKKVLPVIAFVVLAFTACKKDPAKNLYQKWQVESAKFENQDDSATNAVISQGVYYDFSKKGNFTLESAGQTMEGTFEVSKDGSSLTTTMNNTTETFKVENLTESNVKLSTGDNSLTLKSAK